MSMKEIIERAAELFEMTFTKQELEVLLQFDDIKQILTANKNAARKIGAKIVERVQTNSGKSVITFTQTRDVAPERSLYSTILSSLFMDGSRLTIPQMRDVCKLIRMILEVAGVDENTDLKMF
ncbi:hypothetical protein EIN_354250 [Entamoeba invadens IP1]|uniref:Uncharacterized protein n=1 Tax=Entamoeba invadens IP1 TaxID=370355 RepID=L7FMZ5_ENTIV|nr:hypothetical protein EIN_354250 [Entamoeba invadens IP1]ELP87153.1 hypothetical protein EIN_354250 [Entamoeba invadens IP1]|eukprot:XP_004253924.1 hypothetical protein EIN_354250 [Entamoeba invadens IP1]